MSALEELTTDGTPVSTAVRDALVEAAARHVKARLRAEAEALAADLEDRAEAAQDRSEVARDIAQQARGASLSRLEFIA